MTETDVALLVRRFRADGFDFPDVTEGLTPQGIPADDMLDTRMLYSTLVDADFIETETHFAGDQQQPRQYRPEGPPPALRRCQPGIPGYTADRLKLLVVVSVADQS